MAAAVLEFELVVSVQYAAHRWWLPNSDPLLSSLVLARVLQQCNGRYPIDHHPSSR